MRYLVIIRRTATGYSVDVPDLPGCVATGITVEHARQMIAQAAQFHLELMCQAGETPANPSRSIESAVDNDAGEEFYTWIEVETSDAVASGT